MAGLKCPVGTVVIVTGKYDAVLRVLEDRSLDEDQAGLTLLTRRNIGVTVGEGIHVGACSRIFPAPTLTIRPLCTNIAEENITPAHFMYHFVQPYFYIRPALPLHVGDILRTLDRDNADLFADFQVAGLGPLHYAVFDDYITEVVWGKAPMDTWVPGLRGELQGMCRFSIEKLGPEGDSEKKVRMIVGPGGEFLGRGEESSDAEVAAVQPEEEKSKKGKAKEEKSKDGKAKDGKAKEEKSKGEKSKGEKPTEVKPKTEDEYDWTKDGREDEVKKRKKA
ncbi:MAG: hypothetical protein M1833_003514 [Piccolia ochrophora]|nr:MAG: hypothetical protein M1833_003514 [Piccolia ochrophora]